MSYRGHVFFRQENHYIAEYELHSLTLKLWIAEYRLNIFINTQISHKLEQIKERAAQTKSPNHWKASVSICWAPKLWQASIPLTLFFLDTLNRVLFWTDWVIQSCSRTQHWTIILRYLCSHRAYRAVEPEDRMLAVVRSPGWDNWSLSLQ